jgi:hypothetical protein
MPLSCLPWLGICSCMYSRRIKMQCNVNQEERVLWKRKKKCKLNSFPFNGPVYIYSVFSRMNIMEMFQLRLLSITCTVQCLNALPVLSTHFQHSSTDGTIPRPNTTITLHITTLLYAFKKQPTKFYCTCKSYSNITHVDCQSWCNTWR